MRPVIQAERDGFSTSIVGILEEFFENGRSFWVIEKKFLYSRGKRDFLAEIFKGHRVICLQQLAFVVYKTGEVFCTVNESIIFVV